jgi:hypothetical protein
MVGMKRKRSPAAYALLLLISVFVILPCVVVSLLALERITSAYGLNNFGLTKMLETIFTALGING